MAMVAVDGNDTSGCVMVSMDELWYKWMVINKTDVKECVSFVHIAP